MQDSFGFSTAALLQDLPDHLTRALLAEARPKHFPDGATIHERGDAKPGLSIVRSGKVRMGNFTQDGRYISTAILEAGQCFGEFTITAALPRTHHATAIGDVILGEVSKTAFDRLLADNVGLRQALMAMLARRLHAALEYIEDIRVLPLPVRLAKLLIAGASQAERGTSPLVAITQDDLAQTMGVSRVSANKALKTLENKGLITRQYKAIVLPDLQRLKDWVADQTQLAPL